VNLPLFFVRYPIPTFSRKRLEVQTILRIFANDMDKNVLGNIQKMLSQTLKNLEHYNLVHREVFPQVPPKVEYSLTETGKSLMPSLLSLVDWALQHFDDVVVKDIVRE